MPPSAIEPTFRGDHDPAGADAPPGVPTDIVGSRRRFLVESGLAFCALGAMGRPAYADASSPVAHPFNEEPEPQDYPRLEFVYTALISIAALESVGETPSGLQRIIPITGGHFEGPRIRGVILPGAADWNLQRNDGMTVVSASYFMRTNDGVVVKIVNQGVNPRTPPNSKSDRPHFTSPTFEAPKGRYEWLNQAVFVGTLAVAEPGTVRIRVFELS